LPFYFPSTAEQPMSDEKPMGQVIQNDEACPYTSLHYPSTGGARCAVAALRLHRIGGHL
jgi:hypothetical protein